MSLVLKRRFPSLRVIHKRWYSSASTVDAREIDHFQKEGSDWWHRSGATKPLHSMNKLRVPFIRDGLINEGVVAEENVATPKPLKGLSILDVGCGGGILSEALARLGATVTAIDASQVLINVAKNHAEKNKLHNIKYIFSTIEDHSKENFEKYDAIVASEVIEHITEKDKFVASCVSCLKPAGSIFITTINKTWLANLLGIYLVENVIGLVPKGTHQIDKFIEPHKMQRLLEDYNIRTKLIHGFFYNIATERWSWCSSTSLNYGLHAVKFN